ncbi:MAG: ubiquinone biosynthesis protein [Bacteroidetes bacterium]|nr:MAG: ubiquinone biosynthesis protein [Bacteroidota bacterium]
MGLYDVIDRRYRHMRRYNQILRILARYGFEDLVQYMEEKKRFKFLRRLIPKKTLEESKRLTKWEKMRLVCEELGPTFVKFGQILSNRPDLLPEALIFELEKLQDNVPPISGEKAAAVVEEQFKKKISELFDDFDMKPFASASMAQVHRAKLKTGEEVVVKIQRPGIKEMILEDIRIMYGLAAMFHKRMPSIRSFDPVGLVKNFEKSIVKELDFIHESVSVQRFRANFVGGKKESYTYAPKVYQELTTEKVLTLEFINGIKITDIDKLHNSGIDRKLIAKRLADSFFGQVFDYGYFHADPHPGNLFVMKDNVICFVDFGMMGSVMTKDLEQIGHLFLAVKDRDVRRIIRSLQQLSDNPVIDNFRELESDLDEFVQDNSVRSMHVNEMSTILLDMKDIIVKHNMRVPAHFFLLARSIVTLEGLIRHLDPELDLMAMARPKMSRVLLRHYNPIQFTKRVLKSVYELGMYMEDFPRDLKNAIRKINTGKVKVELEHKGIDPFIHTLNRIARQLVSAIIIGSLVIGSSLLILAGVEPKWNGVPALGVAGLIIAGVLTLGMLNNIRKGDRDTEEIDPRLKDQ